MMSRTLLCLVSLIPILLSGTVAAAANPEAAKSRTRGMVLFDKQIKPVLVKRCYKCHSKQGKKVEGGGWNWTRLRDCCAEATPVRSWFLIRLPKAR